jgi:hypothetical protein
LSYAPSFPSHIGHPQWDYHWPDFMKIRHAFLSKKLGPRTEFDAPPASLLPIDRLWWRLDGAEKAHARKIAQLTGALQEIDRETAAYTATVLNDVAATDLSNAPMEEGVFARTMLEAGKEVAQNAGRGHAILDLIDRAVATKQDEAEVRKAKVRLAIVAAEEQHAAGESDVYRKARREYQRLLSPRVKSAGIPIVRWSAGKEREPAWPLELTGLTPHRPLVDSSWLQSPQERPIGRRKLSGEALPRRIALKIYYRVFGRWPHLTMLNPFWSCARPLLAAIEAAKAAGARDALVAVDAPGVFLGLAALPGKVAHVSPEGLGSELFAKALDPGRQFDLCVLQLNGEDSLRLSELLAALAPYLRPGGTVIGFHTNGGRPIAAWGLDGCNRRLAFTGSTVSMVAMRIYVAAFSRIYGRRLLSTARGLAMLALSMPVVLWANLAEAVAARKRRLPDPEFRTSVTIIVQDT